MLRTAMLGCFLCFLKVFLQYSVVFPFKGLGPSLEAPPWALPVRPELVYHIFFRVDMYQKLTQKAPLILQFSNNFQSPR